MKPKTLAEAHEALRRALRRDEELPDRIYVSPKTLENQPKRPRREEERHAP